MLAWEGSALGPLSILVVGPTHSPDPTVPLQSVGQSAGQSSVVDMSSAAIVHPQNTVREYLGHSNIQKALVRDGYPLRHGRLWCRGLTSRPPMLLCLQLRELNNISTCHQIGLLVYPQHFGCACYVFLL